MGRWLSGPAQLQLVHFLLAERAEHLAHALLLRADNAAHREHLVAHVQPTLVEGRRGWSARPQRHDVVGGVQHQAKRLLAVAPEPHLDDAGGRLIRGRCVSEGGGE